MKPKILLVSGVSSIEGGSNAALLENILILREQYDFLVIIPEIGSFSYQLDKYAIPYRIIQSLLWIHRPNKKNGIKHSIKKILINLFAEYKLFKIILNNQVKLIHINTSATGLGWLCSKILKKPLVWHLREASSIGNNFEFDFPKISYFMFRRSVLVPISDFVYNHYRGIFGAKSSFYLINDGINVDGLSNITNLSPSIQKKITIGFLGGYQEHKGLNIVLKSISILVKYFGLKNIELQVFGSQYEERQKYYQNMAKSFGISDFVFLNEFADDLNQVFSNSDIFISAGIEAFGRVTAETIVSGRVAIGIDKGATPEIINNGINGYTFTFQDAADLANKVIRVVENWSPLINHINRNRVQNIEKFSSKNTARRIGMLYQDLISGLKNE